MKLVAIIPHQLAGSRLFGNIHPQHKRWVPSTHWEDDTSPLSAHRLRRPRECVEAFVFIGVAHFGVLVFEQLGCIDVGEEGMANHLDSLT